MRITLAVPWFKKHDAIGNYVYFVTRDLSKKHKIRIVCLRSDRTVPGVLVISKHRMGLKLVQDYISGFKSFLQYVGNRRLNIVSLKSNIGVLLNLIKTLLPRSRETLSVLLWLLKSCQSPDVLWVQMTRLDTMAAAALLSKILWGTKFIVDYHGITPSETFKTKKDKKQSVFAESIAENVLPFADAVIVHSRHMKEEVEKKYGLMSHVIPLGVDLSHFRPTGREQILSTHMLKGKHVIIYVGRLSPHKRIDVLIKSFVLIRKALADSTLIIIGEGTERTNLENLVATRGLQDSVYFLGECSDVDLPKYYSAADVLVIPSVHEGFSLPSIEAMACGTPVIGANSTAIRENLEDCGILFEPNDVNDLTNKVLSLLTDEKLRKNLAKKSLEHAKSFSWKETTNLLEELLRKV